MAQKYKMTIPKTKASQEITQVVKYYSENKFNAEITPIQAQKLVDEFTQATLDIFGENKLIDSPTIETKNEHINIPPPNLEKQETTNLNLDTIHSKNSPVSGFLDDAVLKEEKQN
ncbi:hypothetical protein A1C_06045 [Rickettsia akari str. Hartford]|uniref:Uncharacterized protein n=1 Tax=Rickettsia akari (strain Hartford) TaxID=293614 RepID=A8GPW7_RICAH|nr:hypothetical protein [Rickettsia akari]ABV75442.1 hypothetical protein A1C_06045 [Rickettsia akari str. Hartford]